MRLDEYLHLDIPISLDKHLIHKIKSIKGKYLVVTNVNTYKHGKRLELDTNYPLLYITAHCESEIREWISQDLNNLVGEIKNVLLDAGIDYDAPNLPIDDKFKIEETKTEIFRVDALVQTVSSLAVPCYGHKHIVERLVESLDDSLSRIIVASIFETLNTFSKNEVAGKMVSHSKVSLDVEAETDLQATNTFAEKFKSSLAEAKTKYEIFYRKEGLLNYLITTVLTNCEIIIVIVN